MSAMSGNTTPDPTGAVGMLGPTVPAWQLRAALLISLAVAGGGIVAWTSAPAFFPVLMAGLGAGTVLWPQSHAPGLFLAAAAAGVLFTSDLEIVGWTFAVVFALHAVHLLAGLCALTPWRADVEREALRPALGRFVTVQALCQPLVLLAYFLTIST